MSRMAYYKYIRSAKWREKREQVFEILGRKCSECGETERLHIHHKTYDRLGREKTEDLTVLCKECHEKETIKNKEDLDCPPDKIPWKFKHFVMINGEELKTWNKELSNSECAFLFSVIPYIGYDGKLKSGNGRYINIVVLAKITKLNKTTLYKTVKSLIDKMIICKKKNGKKTEYFMNPWIIRKGNRINKVLRAMFQNYRIRVLRGTKWKDV